MMRGDGLGTRDPGAEIWDIPVHQPSNPPAVVRKAPFFTHRLPATAAMESPVVFNARVEVEAPSLPGCQVERTLVIGDTEGDLQTLRRNLALLGLVDEQGDVNAALPQGFRMMLLDEGDAIRKQVPDGTYLAYLRELDRSTPDGFRTISLAGNHELERLRAGLTKRQAKTIQYQGISTAWLLGVIRGMDIFHLAPPMLYLHGYPSIEFMRLLWNEFVGKGKDSDLLNERFRDAIGKGGRNIDDWCYHRGAQQNLLLYDVGDAVRYFAIHGSETVAICRQLGVHSIVIGHRPCTSGMQEVMVLGEGNGKKIRKEANRLHDSLMMRIHAGQPIVVEREWSNKGVVILRNDVLGKGNHNRYGMLLIRKTGERTEMLAVNTRHHNSQRAQAFMGMDDAPARQLNVSRGISEATSPEPVCG